jgi:hypothetical protein
MSDSIQPTKVLIGLARFSYCNVWQPKAVGEGDDKKYSVSLIIPKSNKALKKKIEDAITAAKTFGKESKWSGKIPANLKMPLRDGDVERPDDEAYADSWFINATSANKPTILGPDKQEILLQDEFYSGCYGYASVNFFPFNSNGSKGIACGLNHLLKAKDGEPLGGRGNAQEDFADLELDQEETDMLS